MAEKVFSDSFDRFAVKREILIHLSGLPEKIIGLNSHGGAEIGVSLGNLVNALSAFLEKGERQSHEAIGRTPTSLLSLGGQLREAGLKTWDAGTAPDAVADRLDAVAVTLVKVCERLANLEKRGSK